MNSGNLNFLEPSGPLQDCNGTDLPLCVDDEYIKFHSNQNVIVCAAIILFFKHHIYIAFPKLLLAELF